MSCIIVLVSFSSSSSLISTNVEAVTTAPSASVAALSGSVSVYSVSSDMTASLKIFFFLFLFFLVPPTVVIVYPDTILPSLLPMQDADSGRSSRLNGIEEIELLTGSSSADAGETEGEIINLLEPTMSSSALLRTAMSRTGAVEARAGLSQELASTL